MAVHTVLNTSQIEHLIAGYQLGDLRNVAPVADGIENTNYFLSFAPEPLHNTPEQELLLTIFEHLNADELEFYIQWLQQLAAHGLPVATALRDRNGKQIQAVEGKPAALFHKLAGQHPSPVEAVHCQAIGSALGELHLAALDIPEQHEGPRSMDWLWKLSDSIYTSLDKENQYLLRKAIDTCTPLFRSELPTGLIHGDLFPDNTLFEGHELTGLVDFYSGGSGMLVFDLAVAVNAWCTEEEGGLNPDKLTALMQGYNRYRSLTEAEKACWNKALVLAAMRFWVSRLADQRETNIERQPGALITQKNPQEYRRILHHHLTGIQINNLC